MKIIEYTLDQFTQKLADYRTTGYRKGLEDGRDEGYEEGWRACQAAMAERLEKFLAERGGPHDVGRAVLGQAIERIEARVEDIKPAGVS